MIETLVGSISDLPPYTINSIEFCIAQIYRIGLSISWNILTCFSIKSEHKFEHDLIRLSFYMISFEIKLKIKSLALLLEIKNELNFAIS